VVAQVIKKCKTCKRDKDMSLFHRNRKSSDGYQSNCAKCCSDYSKQYREEKRKEISEIRKIKYESVKNDPEYLRKKRESKYLGRYGITLDDYEKMLFEQCGVCKICLNPPSGKKKRLAVDHCHITGKVRGLLCDHCNVGLGRFKDDAELLECAILYLIGDK
jgi:hypothetical protein